MKHTIKDWIVATRPWSFPASAMPVLVTLGYMFWSVGEINWAAGLFTILNVVVFHAAGNTWSDYKDYKCGVDREDTVGGLSIVSGQFEAQQIKRFSMALFAVAVAAGLVLVGLTGIEALYFGLAGALLTLFYPWLKYHALGDMDIFLAYSVVPMLGTSFVATGQVQPDVLVLSVPVGFITVGILHANNTRDMMQDARAGIKTFAMNVGGRAASRIYCFEVLFPFVWCIGAVVAGWFPVWSLLVFVALKPAVDNVKKAMQYTRVGMEAMVGIDEKTAQLHLMFSLLLFVSFVVGSFV